VFENRTKIKTYKTVHLPASVTYNPMKNCKQHNHLKRMEKCDTAHLKMLIIYINNML